MTLYGKVICQLNSGESEIGVIRRIMSSGRAPGSLSHILEYSLPILVPGEFIYLESLNQMSILVSPLDKRTSKWARNQEWFVDYSEFEGE